MRPSRIIGRWSRRRHTTEPLPSGGRHAAILDASRVADATAPASRSARLRFAILCAALVGCDPAEQGARDSVTGEDTTRFVVDAEGIGPVRTGTTLPQLSALLGEEVRAAYADVEVCDYVRPRALPPGVSLMVLSDTVARIDVDATGVKTVEGAAVGDSEQRVLELYKGRIHVEPHKYTGPEGHYLVVTPPGDTLHRIIFETDGKVVTRYRAGPRPAVEYVEGCA